ncbi:MAG: LptF/LptG family permease [Planctomycetota bacterium]|jgi:lipopolysaccharide export LptBFGC system permease protein LptF
MLLIDRYIMQRFLATFFLLFALLFLFAAGVDLILNLDEFVQVLRRRHGEDTAVMRQFTTLVGLMVDFQAPRLFLFFAYMHGLVGIGAMGFVLAQMHRHRELVALLASGVSMPRLAMPFLAGMFCVSLIQLLNQEFVLHRVAPLLLRGHGEIGQRGLDEFPVRLVDDGAGNLFQSPAFNPGQGSMESLTVLERDEVGRTTRRITAEVAVWDDRRSGWQLTEGRALRLPDPASSDMGPIVQEQMAFYESALDPRALTVKRYASFAAMLSLKQISAMLENPGMTDTDALQRHRYARFATVGLNILVLFVALPSFLLREPASLMRQSLFCAGMALPAMMGGALGMMIQLPGMSPLVSVFLPVIIMFPMAVGRWTFMKT